MSGHALSIFPVENQSELESSYRLVDIDGPFDGCGDPDQAEKNLNLLSKLVSFAERLPVALVFQGGKRLLAVPGDRELGTFEHSLTPHVVTLRPRDEVHPLRLGAASRTERHIGTQFLNFAIRSPLRTDDDLWSPSPYTYFLKRPLNWREDRRDVDVFEGFGFRLMFLGERLFLALRLSTKYVESAWLVDRPGGGELRDLRMRHLLYHMGHRWFPVQLIGAHGKSISEARFTPEGEAPTDVYGYTISKTKNNPPNWIRGLDPDSPAILYRYPGKSVQRYGAAALCKLMLGTPDPRVRSLHRWSIIPPAKRFGYLSAIAAERFSRATFSGTPVRIGTTPHRVERRCFPVPAIQFGGERIVGVVSRSDPHGIDPSQLGRERMSRLLDPNNGLAVARPFGNQFLLVPRSMPRPAVDDFRSRIEKTVRTMAHSAFSLKPVLYDDSSRTLRDQVEAIIGALDQNSIEQGHGLFILPERRHPQLYHYLKKKLLDRLQMKCVAAERVRSFYGPGGNNGNAFQVRGDREKNYVSYLRYTALGLLIVNRLWPWVLAEKLHHDIHIGIDVLNGSAAFCFLYEGGRRCFPRVHPSKQKEKLSRRDLSSILYEHLKTDLVDCPTPPRSIVIHRDGKLFEREWQGVQDAVSRLIREGHLQTGVVLGAIEIQKHDAMGLRIVRESDRTLVNPDIGSYFVTDDGEAILCTTGEPFRFQGTVDPIKVKVARGPLVLEAVLEDVFALSQLCWMVPDRCIRLPITLKLCDDFLRSVAGDTDQDEEEEELEDEATPDAAMPGSPSGDTTQGRHLS